MRSWPAIHEAGMKVVSVVCTKPPPPMTEVSATATPVSHSATATAAAGNEAAAAFIKAAINLYDIPAKTVKPSTTSGLSPAASIQTPDAETADPYRGVSWYTLPSFMTDGPMTGLLARIDVVYIATDGPLHIESGRPSPAAGGVAATATALTKANDKERFLRRCIELGKHVVVQSPVFADMAAYHRIVEQCAQPFMGKQQPKVLWMDTTSAVWEGPRMKALHSLLYNEGTAPLQVGIDHIGTMERMQLHLCFPSVEAEQVEEKDDEQTAEYWSSKNRAMHVVQLSRHTGTAKRAMDSLLCQMIGFVLVVMRGVAPSAVTARILRRHPDSEVPAVIQGELRFPVGGPGNLPPGQHKPTGGPPADGTAAKPQPSPSFAVRSADPTPPDCSAATNRPTRSHVVSFYVSTAGNAPLLQSCTITGSEGAVLLHDALYPTTPTEEEVAKAEAEKKKRPSPSFRQTVVHHTQTPTPSGGEARTRHVRSTVFPCDSDEDGGHPTTFWRTLKNSLTYHAADQFPSAGFSHLSRGGMMAARFGGGTGANKSRFAIDNVDAVVARLQLSWMVHQVLATMQESMCRPESS